MNGGRWITDLPPQTQVVDAARRVLALRLENVRDHLGFALRNADEDPEHIHQLRVGTRRAGAALSIFSACLPTKTQNATRKHLKGLRRASGIARDWDVFLLRLKAEQERKIRTWTPALDLLTGLALGEREKGLLCLHEACPEYPFPLERQIAETVSKVRPAHDYPDSTPLAHLAQPLLAGLFHKLHTAGSGDLDDLDQLHRIRIVSKRLRYAMEVFSECYKQDFRDVLYANIESIQSVLGKVNDAHVSSKLLMRIRDRLRVMLPAQWRRMKPGIEGLLKANTTNLLEAKARFNQPWLEWTSRNPERLLALWALPGMASHADTQLDGNPGAGARSSGEPEGNPVGV